MYTDTRTNIVKWAAKTACETPDIMCKMFSCDLRARKKTFDNVVLVVSCIKNTKYFCLC